MAEGNSYKPAIQGALDDIQKIEDRIGQLAKAIDEAGKAAKAALGSFAPKTPGDMDKQVKALKQALDDLAATQKQQDASMKQREAALKRQADLQFKYSNEKIKAEQQAFKELVKASRIQKQYNIEKEKEAQIAAKNAATNQQEARGKKLLRDLTLAERIELKNLYQEKKKLTQTQNSFIQNAQREQAILDRYKEKYGVVALAVRRLKDHLSGKWNVGDDFASSQRILKETGKELDRNAQKIRNLTQVSAQEGAAQNSVAGAYDRLNTQRKEAQKRLQDLIVAQGRNSKQTRQAQKEYDALTKKINQANAASKNFATGLGGVMAGVGNLMAAFGVVGGLYLFADIAKQGFQLAKTLDSLQFSMKTIITDSNELARTQAFLTDITERYGASIVTTTERYIKFLAAAKQSNVSLADTEQIFGSVTKAAGVLGLKTHELEGIYLALEQMLSKGKVTTEELRRQLGERLPGAFGIMADALGVSVQGLDEMLRKGEILSAEALPKFANALEKAYGIEQLDRIENLNAASNRLTNAWVEFVRTVTESEGAVSKSLTFMINNIADAIKGLELMISTADEVNGKFNTIFENQVYKETLAAIKKEAESTGVAVEELAAKYVDSNDDMVFSIKETIAALKEENKALEERTGLEKWLRGGKGTAKWWENAEAIAEAEHRLSLYNGMLRASIELEGEHAEVIEERTSNYADQSFFLEKLKEAKDAYAATSFGDDAERAALKAHIDILEEILKKWDLSVKKQKEIKEIMKGSVAYYEKIAAALKDQQSRLATTTEEWKRYHYEINRVEHQIYKLKVGFDELNKLLGQGMDLEGWDSIIELTPDTSGTEFIQTYLDDLKGQFDGGWGYLLDLSKEVADEEVRIEMEKQAAIKYLRERGFEDAKGRYLQYSDEQKEALQNAMQSELDLRKDFKDAITNLVVEGGEAIMEARVEAVDEEIAKNREKYAEILAAEEWSEEQRASIEAERDLKEAQLEKKKMKREKEAFMVQQGLALAQIALDLAKTITAINLTAAALDAVSLGTAGTAYRLAALPWAIGTAAAQVGVVAAQTFPRFEKGTEDAPEGWAWVDEKRPEVHLDKHGNIKSLGEDGPNLRYLSKGDEIIPSRETFFSQFNVTDMQRAIWDLNMATNGRELSQKQVDDSLVNEIKGLKASNEKVWREVKKLASRPVQVRNTVEIKDPRPY